MPNSRLSIFAFIALAALLASGSGPAFGAERLSGGDIGCRWPVRPDDTGQALLMRLGTQVRVAELADTEGEETPGLLLYPDDLALQLEIETSGDPVSSKVAWLNLRQADSRWTVFGLRVGMTLAEVTKANGGPLDLSGFQQYGRGGVFSVIGDFRPGTLAGGCRLQVIFTAPGTVDFDGPLYGREHIASDNPDLLRIAPLVSELGVSWEKPPE